MLALTGALFALVAIFVDLKLVVDESFFFPAATRNFGGQRRSKKNFRHGGDHSQCFFTVLAGTITDILTKLFVLLLLGGAQWKMKRAA